MAAYVEKKSLILNKLRNIVNVTVIRAPSFGQRHRLILKDIAILTEGQIIT
jgi:chaperonin GroEL